MFTDFLTATGTHSVLIAANSGARAQFATGAVIGNQAGIRTNIQMTVASNNPRLQFRYNHDGTNVLAFVGFMSGASFPSWYQSVSRRPWHRSLG